MDELPKIARERLKRAGDTVAQPSSGAPSHPDADLMTAFLEGSLPEGERAQVLEHLSRCAECRAVAALALPEQEPAAVPVQTREQRIWARWTVLRWGTLAASALVIAIAVLVLRPHETKLQRYLPKASERPLQAPAPRSEGAMSKKPEETPSAPNIAVPKQAPGQARHEESPRTRRPPALPVVTQTAPTMNLEAKKDRRDQAQNYAQLQQAQQQQARLGGQAGGVVGGVIGGPHQRQPTQAAQNVMSKANSAPTRAVEPCVPVAPCEVPVAPPPPQTPKPASAQPEVAVSRAVAPQAGEKALDNLSTGAAQMQTLEVEKAKGRAYARKTELKESAWRWAVGDTGKLVRSADAGRTWNAVAVGDGTKFRALSANGNDIWAGGGRGALYHSQDAGTHWTRVAVASAGTELTGDIVRVEFTDPQHGYLVTASGERWATVDGGRSWAIGGTE